jgi:hypothetical protein
MFLTAAPEHPWMQGVALVSSALAQLISFGHYGYYISLWMYNYCDNMAFDGAVTAQDRHCMWSD